MEITIKKKRREERKQTKSWKPVNLQAYLETREGCTPSFALAMGERAVGMRQNDISVCCVVHFNPQNCEFGTLVHEDIARGEPMCR